MFQSTPPREGRPFIAFPFFRGTKVSIHAPTRGATGGPRPGFVDHQVSIHAPTRGATTRRRAAARFAWRFNPRPHARGDPLKITPVQHLVSRRHCANRPGFYRAASIKTASTQENLCKSRI